MVHGYGFRAIGRGELMKCLKDLLQDPSMAFYRDHVKAAAEMLIDEMDAEGKEWPEARKALISVLERSMNDSTVKWQDAAEAAYRAVLGCLCDEELPFCGAGK